MDYIKRLFKGEAKAISKFHKYATICWFTIAFPIMIFFPDSIRLLVFISVYANVVGHWSSWQASKVEIKQDVDADVREVLDRVNYLIELIENKK